jgi:hypothetical protein
MAHRKGINGPLEALEARLGFMPLNAIGVGIAIARHPLPGPGGALVSASGSLSKMTGGETNRGIGTEHTQ